MINIAKEVSKDYYIAFKNVLCVDLLLNTSLHGL